MCRWIAIVVVGVMAAAAWAWSPPYEDHRGRFVSLNDLTATVDCHDGEETLAIPIAMTERRGSGFIFAVPAAARDVQLAILPGATYCEGQWPTQDATDRLKVMTQAAMLTQLYPVVGMLFRPSLSRTEPLPANAGGVVVQQNGLRCEVTDGRTEADLLQALQRAGVRADPGELHTFAAMADGRHCFVTVDVEVPRLTQDEQLLQDMGWAPLQDHSQTVQILFPSKAPVLPAALRDYQPAGVESNVVIRGYYRPVRPPENARWELYTGVRRRVLSHRSELVEGNVRYTRMTYPSTWPMPEIDFVPQTSPRLTFAEGMTSLSSGPLVAAAVLLPAIAALSYLSGGIAGVLVFRNWRRYASIGLWNLLTIIAVWVRVGTGGRSGGSEKLANRFALCFSIVYMLLCLLSEDFLRRLWAGNPIG
jgi:hypothetical protein